MMVRGLAVLDGLTASNNDFLDACARKDVMMISYGSGDVFCWQIQLLQLPLCSVYAVRNRKRDLARALKTGFICFDEKKISMDSLSSAPN